MALVMKFACFLTTVIALYATIASPELAIIAALVALLCSYYLAGQVGLLTIRNPLLVFSTITFVVLAAYDIALRLGVGGGALEIGTATFTLPIFLSSRAQDAAAATAICLIAMLLGAWFVMFRATRSTTPGTRLKAVARDLFPIYTLIAVLPLCANFVLYAYTFSDDSYVAIHLAGFGPLKYVLFSIYLSYGAMLLIFLVMISKGLTSRQKLALFLTVGLWGIVYAGLYQTRSNLFILIMLFLYVYWEKLSFTRVVLLVAATVLVFLAIAFFREPVLLDVAVGAAGWQLLGLGSFVDNVAYALNAVDEQGMAYGATYARIFLDTGSSPGLAYVEEFAPDQAALGGGFGFFYVAEAILNFGVLGAGILFFTIGYVLAKSAISRSSFVFWVVNPALVATSFLLVRNEFASAGKSFLYLVLGFLLALWITVLLKWAAKSSRTKLLSVPIALAPPS